MSIDAFPELYARPLFAFGTLQDADVFAIISGGLSINSVVREDAWMADHSVRSVLGGLYPILQRDSGARAPGTLLFDLPAAVIDRLVQFEHPEFVLVAVEIATAKRVFPGACFWPSDVPPASEELWSLDRWRIEKKAEWIQQALRWSNECS